MENTENLQSEETTKKKKTSKKEEIETTVEIETVDNSEPLNLDTKITIRNIAPWGTGFRRFDMPADVDIVGNGSVRISRGEVMSQVQAGKRLFTGTDGMGSHACLFIDDRPTRVELGFEEADGSRKQLVFSDDLVKEVFSIKNNKQFEEKFKECFITRAEHKAVISAIKKLGLNDFDKIRFVENYTNYKVQ